MINLKNWAINHKKILAPAGIFMMLLIGIVVSANMLQQQPAEQYIAEVNNIGIPLSAYNARVSQQTTFFGSTDQSPSQSEISEQVVEALIREQLVANYAETRNITVEQNEVDARFQQRAEAYGSEAELLKTLQDLYGKTKEDYLKTQALDILRERVASSVSDELSISLQEWLSEQATQVDIIRYDTE